MNPLAVLSLSCFLVAACLFVYWLYDLAKLRRGLREDQELDRPFSSRERPRLDAPQN